MMKKAIIIFGCILAALAVMAAGFFGLIASIFGNLRQDTVVKTIPSPDGTYYAQVIDSDQGAMGGATLVQVCSSKGHKKPQLVYQGKWGEAAYLEIYWRDDTCLVINSVEYEIG